MTLKTASSLVYHPSHIPSLPPICRRLQSHSHTHTYIHTPTNQIDFHHTLISSEARSDYFLGKSSNCTKQISGSKLTTANRYETKGRMTTTNKGYPPSRPADTVGITVTTGDWGLLDANKQQPKWRVWKTLLNFLMKFYHLFVISEMSHERRIYNPDSAVDWSDGMETFRSY